MLLEKLITIKNLDSWAAIKPWLARSTFQYAPGVFYDPTTGVGGGGSASGNISVRTKDVHTAHRDAGNMSAVSQLHDRAQLTPPPPSPCTCTRTRTRN